MKTIKCNELVPAATINVKVDATLQKLNILRQRLRQLKLGEGWVLEIVSDLLRLRRNMVGGIGSISVKLKTKIYIAEYALTCWDLKNDINTFTNALFLVNTLRPERENPRFLAEWAIKTTNKNSAINTNVHLLLSA